MEVSSLGIVPDLLALTLAAAVLSYVTFRAPPPRLARALRALILGVVLFVAGNVAEELASGPLGRWITLALLYGGLMLITPAWWSLCVGSSDMHGRPLGRWAVLLARWAPVVSAGFFLVLITNPWHQQFLIDRPTGRNTYQPVWYAFATLNYGLIFGGLAILAKLALRPPTLEARRQALVWMAASLVPTIANLAFVTLPFPAKLDPTPVGYALSCIILALGSVQREFMSLGAVGPAGLFDLDLEPIVLLDAEGIVRYANRAAGTWFAASPPRVGESLSVALGDRLCRPGEEAPIGADALQTLLTGDDEAGVLLAFVGGDRIVRVERLEPPARFAGRKTIAVRFRDETELFCLSKSAAEQASMLETVLASSRDGFLIADAEGRVQYANRRSSELLGIDLPTDHGRDSADFGEAFIDRLADPAIALDDLGEVERRPLDSHTFRLQIENGARLECTTTPLIRDGRLMGRVWQSRDRTAEHLAEEGLRNTQKLESLGVMAGGIAHDFNNLLVGVLGNAELARMELPKDSACEEPLAAIQMAAEQAGDLTRQLLVYAGLDDTTSLEQLDLVELVRSTRDVIAVSIPKNVELRFDMPERQVVVHGDASQLRQVLMNLIINAAEAIGEDAGLVQVSIGRRRHTDAAIPVLPGHSAEPGDRVCLRVEDDGCGMDEQTRSRLFDPFFTTKFEGRGLGLAATLGIVRSHGGALRVESKPGRGTRFEVFLPEHPEPLAPASMGAAARWEGTGRILVVDDEPAVRHVTLRMLERMGFEVTECAGGREAIALLQEAPDRYRAVVLDVAMPVVSGLDVARHLAEQLPNLPVILCSGHPPDHEDISVAGFVRKPFTRSQLAEALRSALES